MARVIADRPSLDHHSFHSDEIAGVKAGLQGDQHSETSGSASRCKVFQISDLRGGKNGGAFPFADTPHSAG
jgi:hypothetical protein